MIQQYYYKEKLVAGHVILRFKGYNKARQILERKREITSDKWIAQGQCKTVINTQKSNT